MILEALVAALGKLDIANYSNCLLMGGFKNQPSCEEWTRRKRTLVMVLFEFVKSKIKS